MADRTDELSELPGLERFEALGRSLLDIVSPARWDAADLSSREGLAADQHATIRRVWSLGPGSLKFADDLGRGVRGRFALGTGTLSVGRWLLEGDVGETLATLVHENRHNLQRDVMRGHVAHPAGARGAAEVQRWRNGLRDYSNDRGNVGAYAYNPLETDARAVASGVLVSYWRGAYRLAVGRNADAGG